MGVTVADIRSVNKVGKRVKRGQTLKIQTYKKKVCEDSGTACG